MTVCHASDVRRNEYTSRIVKELEYSRCSILRSESRSGMLDRRDRGGRGAIVDTLGLRPERMESAGARRYVGSDGWMR